MDTGLQFPTLKPRQTKTSECLSILKKPFQQLRRPQGWGNLIPTSSWTLFLLFPMQPHQTLLFWNFPGELPAESFWPRVVCWDTLLPAGLYTLSLGEHSLGLPLPNSCHSTRCSSPYLTVCQFTLFPMYTDVLSSYTSEHQNGHQIHGTIVQVVSHLS